MFLLVVKRMEEVLESRDESQTFLPSFGLKAYICCKYIVLFLHSFKLIASFFCCLITFVWNNTSDQGAFVVYRVEYDDLCLANYTSKNYLLQRISQLFQIIRNLAYVDNTTNYITSATFRFRCYFIVMIFMKIIIEK